MKKKSYTQKELSEFRKLILKRKEEILESIKRISEDNLKRSQKDATGDISGYTYHMADVATDTYDRDFSLNLASAEQDELYELEEALRKIEEGTFGICEGCNSLIPKVRLRAVPYARFCIKCQERKDRGL
ncbi:MAG: TraR/DksA family transcriptional regulator [Candidatus Omnitrophica bacterium]|nr:TraR/DksA family transcriptional regulator [Candidatus Omnitrophota bacterium]